MYIKKSRLNLTGVRFEFNEFLILDDIFTHIDIFHLKKKTIKQNRPDGLTLVFVYFFQYTDATGKRYKKHRRGITSYDAMRLRKPKE